MGSKTAMKKMSIAAEAAVHARIANRVKCYIYNITYAYNTHYIYMYLDIIAIFFTLRIINSTALHMKYFCCREWLLATVDKLGRMH